MNGKAGLSRRDFFRGAVAVGAVTATSAVLAGCTKNSAASALPQTWDAEADVIVVGFGGAGAAASLMAADAGAKVILLEKDGNGGGSTALSGQGIFAAGSSIQKTLGIDDTWEAGLAYYMAGAADGREDLLTMLVKDSAPAFEWLLGLGMKCKVELTENTLPGLGFGGREFEFKSITPPIQRSHFAESVWIPLQAATQKNDNIEVRMSTPATSLIQDPDTGTIIGVTADAEGTLLNIKAKKGVVLSAGGFSRNEDLMLKHVGKNVAAFTGRCDDGDGMKLGLSVGAGLQFTSGVIGSIAVIHPPTYSSLVGAGNVGCPGRPGYIVVNNTGRRYYNERAFYLFLNEAAMKQPDGKSFLIVAGEAGRAGIDWKPASHPKAGNQTEVAEGATIAELAGKIGVDPASLEETVNRWNADCKSGTDSAFGRAEDMQPIEGTPFYAVALRGGNASTAGGLDIDTGCRVLCALTGKPIPHLYAAGVNSGALGRLYPQCGSAVSMAVVTGRAAGTNVVSETPWDE